MCLALGDVVPGPTCPRAEDDGAWTKMLQLDESMVDRQRLGKITMRSWLTSSRPRPTAGRSRTTGILSFSSCCEGPMPDRSNICGEPNTPPHTITSRLAPTANLGPSREVEICTPVARRLPPAPDVNKMRSVWTDTAMVRLGRWRTSCRRYEVAVELPAK